MSAAPEFGKEAIEQIVRQAITSILPNLPPENVLTRSALADLGADSVDRIEILLLVMSRIGIDEPISNFSNIPTIDALVDYLYRGISSGLSR
jgi:polyketide biosynthesis acyl carrier protein